MKVVLNRTQTHPLSLPEREHLQMPKIVIKSHPPNHTIHYSFYLNVEEYIWGE